MWARSASRWMSWLARAATLHPLTKVPQTFSAWYVRWAIGGYGLVVCLVCLATAVQPPLVARISGIVVGIPFLVWTYRGFRTGTVIAKTHELVVRTLWRTRHFPWDAILSLTAEKGSVGVNPLPRVCLVVTTRDGRRWRAQDFNSWWRRGRETYVDRATARLNQILEQHRSHP